MAWFKLTQDQIEYVQNSNNSIEEIATHFGVGVQKLSYYLRTKGIKRKMVKQCALPECGKDFPANDPRKLCCCDTHFSRLMARNRFGIKTERRECLLPECREQVLCTGANGHYCCKSHHALDYRRKGYKRKSNSKQTYDYYRKAIGSFHPCMVCGETMMVDEHHTVYHGNKSDKTSPTVWLCCNHHMAVHRGFAKFIDGKFTWVYLDIIDDLKRKQPEAYELLKHGFDSAETVHRARHAAMRNPHRVLTNGSSQRPFIP